MESATELEIIKDWIGYLLDLVEHRPINGVSQEYVAVFKIDDNPEIELFGAIYNYEISSQYGDGKSLTTLIRQIRKGKKVVLTMKLNGEEEIYEVELEIFANAH